jgi:outer membrane protein OmpA-like peptidoglycan-associated protein
MSKQKKESFFWTSYSDLMTSLFFVMLLLFVLVTVLLHNKMVEIEKEKQATEQQLNKIREIEESVKNIDRDYFEYNADFKRHTLKNITVSFRKGSSDFNDIQDEQRDRLLKAGHSIRNLVDAAVKENPEVKYLLIVEGQASKDSYQRNFELSYERALALVNFWKDNSLNFNSNNCEIMISGSGTESLFREDEEPANQRFVIHIIPKTGVIDNK